MSKSEKVEKLHTEEISSSPAIDSTTTKSETFTKTEQKDILVPKFILVTIHKARNLEKKGMLGKADPYAKVTVESQSEKSITVKNNHSPEWEFSSNFDLQNIKSDEIKVELFDEDIGKDDKLGHKNFSIKNLVKSDQLSNQWLPLEGCKCEEII